MESQDTTSPPNSFASSTASRLFPLAVAPTTASVTFLYVDETGAELATAATKTYENGTYTDFSDMVVSVDG